MRFFSVLTNDIKYQVKYGFYSLYAFVSAVYMAVLLITPVEYKSIVASIIILSDPAMLGMFFIGGIWLLEKEEGLHSFWNITPIRGMEYIVSKALSLSLISTISAVFIALLGVQEYVSYIMLSWGVFIGSFIFTTLGLLVASYARSVNNYVLITTPIATLVSLPPILVALGIYHPVLDFFPGTALWRIIGFSIGTTDRAGIWLWMLLVLWLGIALVLANVRIPSALHMEGGEIK